jgi:hypothetical protein
MRRLVLHAEENQSAVCDWSQAGRCGKRASDLPAAFAKLLLMSRQGRKAMDDVATVQNDNVDAVLENSR